MALIDLKSDLASLKYGSNKPIVRHNMGNDVSQASARLDDVKRLAGILTRAPGLKFVANQSLLQSAKIGSAVGKKLGSGGSIAGAVLAGIGAAAKASIGTGLFLTANAGKAGTGFHSVNPSVAQSYLTDGPQENPITSGGGGGGSFLDKAIAKVSQVATAIGAQSANYHAGKEVIGGAQTVSKNYTEPKFKGEGKDQGKSTPIGNYAVGDKVVDGSKLVQRSNKYKEFKENGKIDDDQRYLENGKSQLTLKKDIKDKRLKSYYLGKGDELQQTGVLSEALGVDEQDIIPFVFNFYTPGSETDKYLYFRALLDSLSDTYNASWSGIKYVGRAEEFHTYTGFGRTMSFAFKAAAFSKKQLFPIYSKLNHLVGSTAPTYGSEGLFMRGTLLKLTIGDYIYEQNGFLSSVSLTWNTDYQWELEGDLKVPHLLDVSCEFTPIHSFNPEFGKEEKRFIGRIGDTSPGSSGDFSRFTGESTLSADATDFSRFTGGNNNPSDFSRFTGG